MNTAAKLDALRAAMRAAKVAAYLVPGTDPHQSEYVPACWERREWLSGFTGSAGEVLAAHELITGAYRTDVRPLLAQVRKELGVPIDPIAAYRSSGYEEKIRSERGLVDASGGFQ